jgi:DNA helicase-2/ATP-dependent DNA helicase PcrA
VAHRAYADEPAEAAGVADEITRLVSSGVPAHEIAVLFRINAQSESFEEALAERGVSYVVRGAARFFERPEVRQAVTLLRGAAHGGGPDDVAETVRATLAGLGWTTEAPTARGQVRDRWESWQALAELATDFVTAHPDGGLGDLVGDLDRRAAEQHAPTAGGVTLATLHAAKGLEWDAVFVTGLQDGTLPITYAETPTEIEEERRLLYVGVTRARLHLSLSWARARQPGGRQSRKPTRFLPVLDTAGGRAGVRKGAAARSKGAVTCRECGARLATGQEKKLGRCGDCPAAYDEALFERLRAWRLATATAEKVPAYVVFTDATLQLVAEHLPRTEPELLKISGIGRAKLDKYGDDLLEVLAGPQTDL